VLWQWKISPREAVGAPSLEVRKARLDGALGSLSWGEQTCLWLGVETVWALRSTPTQAILWKVYEGLGKGSKIPKFKNFHTGKF